MSKTWAEKREAITEQVAEAIAISVIERRRAAAASGKSPEEIAAEIAHIDATMPIVMHEVMAKLLTRAYGGAACDRPAGPLH